MPEQIMMVLVFLAISSITCGLSYLAHRFTPKIRFLPSFIALAIALFFGFLYAQNRGEFVALFLLIYAIFFTAVAIVTIVFSVILKVRKNKQNKAY